MDYSLLTTSTYGDPADAVQTIAKALKIDTATMAHPDFADDVRAWRRATELQRMLMIVEWLQAQVHVEFDAGQQPVPMRDPVFWRMSKD